VRDASSESQPSHSDEAVATSRNRDVERVEMLVDLKPRRPGPDADNRTARHQGHGIQICHVYRDAAVDVGKPCAWRMALAFDGKVATVGRGNDGNGPRGIFRSRGANDTPWFQSRFLQRPVRALGRIVGLLVGKTDFVAELLGQSSTLAAG
jgi:hypothetical protein